MRWLVGTMFALMNISSTALDRTPLAPAGDMQFQCLAITAFTEARDQGELGMALVVHTVLERARHKHAHDLCAIAAKSYNGFRNWRTTRLPWRVNPAAWEQAVLATSNTIDGVYRFGACKGATFYYNPALARPYWRKHMRVNCRYKDHLFLSPRG